MPSFTTIEESQAILNHSLTNQKTDVDSLSKTVNDIFNYIELHGIENLNLSILPENTQGEQLAAALRSTHMWKNDIKGWDLAFSRAKSILLQENKNIEDILYGL